MNWKDYPQLFANGKFYVDAEPLTSISEDWYEFDGYAGIIIGVKNDHNGDIIDHINLETDECKLIARPISDMSDEERAEFVELHWEFENDYSIADIVYERGHWFVRYDYHCTRARMVFANEDMRMPQTIYLLSIGVYPFDDDTDVIWRYENE